MHRQKPVRLIVVLGHPQRIKLLPEIAPCVSYRRFLLKVAGPRSGILCCSSCEERLQRGAAVDRMGSKQQFANGQLACDCFGDHHAHNRGMILVKRHSETRMASCSARHAAGQPPSITMAKHVHAIGVGTSAETALKQAATRGRNQAASCCGISPRRDPRWL